MKRLTLGLAAAAAIALASSWMGGCNGDTDPVPPTPDAGPTEPAWQVVFEGIELDRAVVSVWGSAPDDVFIVGGPLGNAGFEALALRYDGQEWQDLKPGGADSFWWVSGTGPNDVWMVGENGRIEHFDGTSFTAHTSGTTATLWGVWPFSANDVWAVGGVPGPMMMPKDVLLHYDGSSWTPVMLPEQLGVANYKVWGPSPDEIYIVGEGGTIWHLKSGTWTNESVTGSNTLFTVHGCSASEVYAVGGFDILRSTGDGTWTDQNVDLSAGINGVACAAPGEVVLAGSLGAKQRLVDGSWMDEFQLPPNQDLHGSWAAGNGEFWVVGGDFASSSVPQNPREGVVARYGVGTVTDQIAP
jgi:hypothetical protein